ncbi:MAG: hypothetical protein CMF50_00005 [Legionellales bacterium]|nr:hypothetical protein [Legionellales bacterium]|tara:strand:+ start:22763 stop:25777 length:3015 start_codon:yes stop_codon:yes gene_type:complete
MYSDSEENFAEIYAVLGLTPPPSPKTNTPLLTRTNENSQLTKRPSSGEVPSSKRQRTSESEEPQSSYNAIIDITNQMSPASMPLPQLFTNPMSVLQLNEPQWPPYEESGENLDDDIQLFETSDNDEWFEKLVAETQAEVDSESSEEILAVPAHDDEMQPGYNIQFFLDKFHERRKYYCFVYPGTAKKYQGDIPSVVDQCWLSNRKLVIGFMDGDKQIWLELMTYRNLQARNNKLKRMNTNADTKVDAALDDNQNMIASHQSFIDKVKNKYYHYVYSGTADEYPGNFPQVVQRWSRRNQIFNIEFMDRGEEICLELIAHTAYQRRLAKPLTDVVTQHDSDEASEPVIPYVGVTPDTDVIYEGDSGLEELSQNSGKNSNVVSVTRRDDSGHEQVVQLQELLSDHYSSQVNACVWITPDTKIVYQVGLPEAQRYIYEGKKVFAEFIIEDDNGKFHVVHFGTAIKYTGDLPPESEWQYHYNDDKVYIEFSVSLNDNLIHTIRLEQIQSWEFNLRKTRAKISECPEPAYNHQARPESTGNEIIADMEPLTSEHTPAEAIGPSSGDTPSSKRQRTSEAEEPQNSYNAIIDRTNQVYPTLVPLSPPHTNPVPPRANDSQVKCWVTPNTDLVYVDEIPGEVLEQAQTTSAKRIKFIRQGHKGEQQSVHLECIRKVPLKRRLSYWVTPETDVVYSNKLPANAYRIYDNDKAYIEFSTKSSAGEEQTVRLERICFAELMRRQTLLVSAPVARSAQFYWVTPDTDVIYEGNIRPEELSHKIIGSRNIYNVIRTDVSGSKRVIQLQRLDSKYYKKRVQACVWITPNTNIIYQGELPKVQRYLYEKKKVFAEFVIDDDNGEQQTIRLQRITKKRCKDVCSHWVNLGTADIYDKDLPPKSDWQYHYNYDKVSIEFAVVNTDGSTAIVYLEQINLLEFQERKGYITASERQELANNQQTNFAGMRYSLLHRREPSSVAAIPDQAEGALTSPEAGAQDDLLEGRLETHEAVEKTSNNFRV